MDTYVLSTLVSVTASTAKTISQIAAPATKRVRLTGISLAFDGAASAVPTKVELLRQTTSGTMTLATPVPLDANAPSSQTTCGSNATSEPSAGVVLYSWYVTPSGGLFNVNFVSGEEPVIDESERIGIRVTSNIDCNSIANITFLE